MIIIGSDHTGIELKNKIKDYLKENQRRFIDVTDFPNQTGDDYPDIAQIICKQVLKNDSNIGIAICGTGIGISIVCNKIKGIRAALCVDEYMAEMSRRHNKANVLCLGARLKYSERFENVETILDAFLNSFYDGGRHDVRIQKISDIDKAKGGV